MYLYALSLTNLPEVFSCSLNVWDHNGDVPIVVIGSIVVVCMGGVVMSLNRNLGKYQLPHLWDNILQDTPALQLK